MTDPVRATHAVVDFIVRTRWSDFPAEAVATAKRCLIDGFGVVLAGSTTRGSAILRDYIRTLDEASDATVLAARPFRCGVPAAALANGASGHAMDFDDTQLSSTPDRIFGLLTHPTVPPLAAACNWRTRSSVGTEVHRGVPHGLRGGVQDCGGYSSVSLPERVPFVRDRRHVRRCGRCGQAPRARRAGDGSRDRHRG